MNVRNTAFLTLALLVIAAPAFASQTQPNGGNKPAAKPGITAQALELGKAGLKKVTDHPYISGGVALTAVAGTAAVVAYKKSPKFKAQVDAKADAVKTAAQASYKAISAKLATVKNHQITRSEAICGSAALVAASGLYYYADSIKDVVLGAKPAGKQVREGGLKGKLSDAYKYCATSKAGLAVQNASTPVKVAAVAGVAVVTAAAYKAYNYFKNRKKAPVATLAVPAVVTAK